MASNLWRRLVSKALAPNGLWAGFCSPYPTRAPTNHVPVQGGPSLDWVLISPATPCTACTSRPVAWPQHALCLGGGPHHTSCQVNTRRPSSGSKRLPVTSSRRPVPSPPCTLGGPPQRSYHQMLPCACAGTPSAPTSSLPLGNCIFAPTMPSLLPWNWHRTSPCYNAGAPLLETTYTCTL